MARQRRSSSQNRISESIAASTGSRAKAERRAAFNQSEAVGSNSTCSMSGNSFELSGVLISYVAALPSPATTGSVSYIWLSTGLGVSK
jgi:hypothetical protein